MKQNNTSTAKTQKQQRLRRRRGTEDGNEGSSSGSSSEPLCSSLDAPPCASSILGDDLILCRLSSLLPPADYDNLARSGRRAAAKRGGNNIRPQLVRKVSASDVSMDEFDSCDDSSDNDEAEDAPPSSPSSSPSSSSSRKRGRRTLSSSSRCDDSSSASSTTTSAALADSP